MMGESTYSQRLGAVRAFVDGLFADQDALVEAVVGDGWPEQMVREGFSLHRQTWTADDLDQALRAELSGLGGAAALEHFVEDPAGCRVRLERPKSVVHIWPALPGAGLTPVLFGALVGASQWIRPSSRGRNFARQVADVWQQAAGKGAPEINLLAPDDDWTFGEVIVISGSDETVSEVRRRARVAAGARRTVVTGYGHRVSFAVVVDDEKLDVDEVAARLATDTVLWHQTGCFSPRAVVFCGSKRRLEIFGKALGDAIGRAEQRLGATELDRGQLAGRAQTRGVAEFTTTVWGDGIGWVQKIDGPFSGERIAAHTLGLHRIESIDELAEEVEVPSTQLQGVALQAPDAGFERWAAALAELGATRVCRPGRLQAPPAGWPHDGRPNVLEWLRATVTDGT